MVTELCQSCYFNVLKYSSQTNFIWVKHGITGTTWITVSNRRWELTQARDHDLTSFSLDTSKPEVPYRAPVRRPRRRWKAPRVCQYSFPSSITTYALAAQN